MPTRRARVLESKGTEIAAWLRPSTLFFLTCPRSSGSRHAARSSASTAAQGWRKSRDAASISERAVAVVKLSSSEGSPILVAPEVFKGGLGELDKLGFKKNELGVGANVELGGSRVGLTDPGLDVGVGRGGRGACLVRREARGRLVL